MRPIKTLLLSFAVSLAWSQTPEAPPEPPPPPPHELRHLDFQLGLQDTSDVLSIEQSAAFNSSAISGRMMLDYLFADRFGQQAKDGFRDNQIDRVRLAGMQDISVEWRQWLGGMSYQSWGLSYGQRAYGNLQKDMTQLLLFGNAEFEGMNIRSEHSSVTSFDRLAFTYGGVRRKGLFEAHYSLGVAGIFNYNSFTARDMQFFTAHQGTYLDVNLENARWRNAKNGVAVTSDLIFKYRPLDGSVFWMGLEDVSSVMLWAEEWERDSSFRFEGIELTGADLLEGDPLERADSFWNAERQLSEKTVWTSLPVTFRLGAYRPLARHHGVELEFRMISGGRYGYLLKGGHIWTASNWALRSEVGYGSMTGLLISEKAEFKFDGWNMAIGIHGVNGWVLPDHSSSLGWSLALSKAL